MILTAEFIVFLSKVKLCLRNGWRIFLGRLRVLGLLTVMRSIKFMIHTFLIGSSEEVFAFTQVFIVYLCLLHCGHGYVRSWISPLDFACQAWWFNRWFFRIKLELFNILLIIWLLLGIFDVCDISHALRYRFWCFFCDLDLLIID